MAKSKVGIDMTEGPVFRTLVSFGAPMILSSLVQQLYSMVDLAVIGLFVGSTGTVAVSVGSELIDFMTLLATAISGAAGTYIAQLFGAKAKERISVAVGTLFSITAILFVIFTSGAVIFHDQLLNLINCPDEAYEAAVTYLVISAFGIPFVFMYNTICGILRGMGESKRPLMFIVIAAVVNIILDVVLVAWLKLDAAGTAIATVASQAGSCVAALIYFYKHKGQFGFKFKLRFFKINGHVVKVICKLGVPQMIRVICVQGSMLWAKSCINAYGLTAAATYSIGNKVDNLLSAFVTGITSGSGSMVGQNLGARKIKRVTQTVNATFLFGLALSAVLAAIFLILPKQMYSVFTGDAEVIAAGVGFMQILAVGIVVTAASSTYKAHAAGVGAAFLCFIIGVLDGICRVVLSLFFRDVIGLEVEAFYWSAALCQLIPGLVCFVYFLSGKWKNRKLLFEE